jgi:hypothetical protein
MELLSISIPSVFISCIYLFLAITAFWLLLRWFDWLGNIKFKLHIMPGLKDNPMAAAIYFGARIIAVALIVATVL